MMLFSEHNERTGFLEEIKLYPEKIHYGAALGHARSVNLGIWGDGGRLESDVAEVMVAEVRKHARQQGNRQIYDKLLPHMVQGTEAFRNAYAAARGQPDRALRGALKAFTGREYDIGFENYDGGGRPDVPVHEAIYDELCRRHGLGDRKYPGRGRLERYG